MKDETRWYRVRSMEKHILNSAAVICLNRGIKYHFDDDGINPPAVYFYCNYSMARRIWEQLGFRVT